MLEEKKMNFQDVVRENRELLFRARGLNIRAGKKIFPTPGLNELKKFFLASLSGARRIGDIADMSSLKLPPLDEALVTKVLGECPDNILVLGQSVRVEYEDEYGGTRPNPRVKLPPELTANNAWLALPDMGIFLPNGRRVIVMISPRYEWIADADIAVLKVKARESLNKELWTRWRQPEITAPTEVIAPIKEQEYGQCKVTNQPLVAYGTVKMVWASWSTFWTTDRKEAERAQEESRRKLAEVKTEKQREVLRNRIAGLYNLHRSSLSTILQDRMYNAVYRYRSGESISELESLISEVEAATKPRTVTDSLKIDLSKLFGGGAKIR